MSDKKPSLFDDEEEEGKHASQVNMHRIHCYLGARPVIPIARVGAAGPG